MRIWSLRVARLQIEREHRLLDLAVEGALGFEEQVLRQLLGQRRAALHDMALHHVLEGGAHQPDRIDAEMLAEAAVLDGDEGVGHIGGKLRRPPPSTPWVRPRRAISRPRSSRMVMSRDGPLTSRLLTSGRSETKCEKKIPPKMTPQAATSITA